MLTPNVSFLGQSNAQVTRLKANNASMSDLIRQMTTKKKTDTFAGLGADAAAVQRYRMDKNRLDSYLGNIDTATTRINLMSTSMSKISSLGTDLVQSLRSQMRSSELDMQTVSSLASQNLPLLSDAVNIDVDGRYLFAGSNAQSQPLTDPDVPDVYIQNQVTDWMNGTQTTAQLLANIDAMTSGSLGLNADLTTSGAVAIRVDQSTEIDYTSLASKNGSQKILQAMSFAANMRKPTGTDAPTTADFNKVLDHILDIASTGISAIDRENSQLSSKFNLMQSVQENHEQDSNLFQTLLSDKEDVDTAEVAVNIQSLQTQISASYQVTSLLKDLSLVNFL